MEPSVSADEVVRRAARDPIYHPAWEPHVRRIVDVVNAMGLWGWLAEFEPAIGFYWCADAKVDAVYLRAGCGRAMFAMCMTLVKKIAQQLFPDAGSEDCCCLCLEPMVRGVVLLECGSRMHRDCVMQLVEQDTGAAALRCPICRQRTIAKSL